LSIGALPAQSLTPTPIDDRGTESDVLGEDTDVTPTPTLIATREPVVTRTPVPTEEEGDGGDDGDGNASPLFLVIGGGSAGLVIGGAIAFFAFKKKKH